MILKVATWNINSIRIRIEQLKELFENHKVDVLLLQETKCQDKDFPYSIINSLGLNYYIVGQKSYNGVAIISRFPMEIELDKLPLYNIHDNDFQDLEARYIETTCNINKKFFRFASIYVPNGQSLLENGEKLEESQRFIYKLNFYERIKFRIKELNEYIKDEYVIFGGDYNVAQEAIDLHNPQSQEGEVGFHPLERQKLREIQLSGLRDAFRYIKPQEKSYTWWDYRTKAFERNLGWRIDYLFASELALQNTSKCFVDLETRKKTQPSDHAPLILEIQL